MFYHVIIRLSPPLEGLLICHQSEMSNCMIIPAFLSCSTAAWFLSMEESFLLTYSIGQGLSHVLDAAPRSVSEVSMWAVNGCSKSGFYGYGELIKNFSLFFFFFFYTHPGYPFLLLSIGSLCCWTFSYYNNGPVSVAFWPLSHKWPASGAGGSRIGQWGVISDSLKYWNGALRASIFSRDLVEHSAQCEISSEKYWGDWGGTLFTTTAA